MYWKAVMSGVVSNQRSGSIQIPTISVRSASLSDVDQIVELAEIWASSDPTSKDSGDGFLVSAYTADAYREFLSSAKYFHVAVEGSRIVGFLIAYTDRAIKPTERLNLLMAQELGPLVVIKQVCTHPNWRRRGIAGRLYQTVLKHEGDRQVIAAVVSKPPNLASERFHHAMGFEPYRRFTPDDGLERTVWLRKGYSTKLLVRQYKHAVDLYKHEDSLNWNKLNNYFYMTTALTAAFGLVVSAGGDKPISDASRAMLVGFCVVGILTSAGFGAALAAGVHYLHARKAAVAALEDGLVRSGGTRLITISGPNLKKGWLKKSPTRHLLRLAPLIVGVFWVGGLIVALVMK